MNVIHDSLVHFYVFLLVKDLFSKKACIFMSNHGILFLVASDNNFSEENKKKMLTSVETHGIMKFLFDTT